jgi:hypothetical protein
MNLDVSKVWGHLMTRSLGDGMSNFERLAVLAILLARLWDPVKVWILLGRLLYGVWRSRSPKQVHSYTCRKHLSTEFFETTYVWNYTNYRQSRNLLHLISGLDCSLWRMCIQILEHDNFLSQIILTGKTKFHISGCVSRHRCAIFDSDPMTEHLEHEYMGVCWHVKQLSVHFSLMRTLLQAIHS